MILREVTRHHGLLLNWKTVVGALVLLLVSLGMLWASEEFSAVSPLWFGRIVPSMASVIATSGIFALIYEIVVRRQQTKYVLEALGLREALVRSGLDDVSTNYMDYDYGQQIKTSTEITIFALYAQTWISRYTPELNEFLCGPKRTLQLCVPSYDNIHLAALAQEFGYSEDELRRKIADSISALAVPAIRGDLGRGTVVRVYMHGARPAYSAYRFDGRILVGTYYASKARRRAPMFEFIDVPGSMFAEFDDDLKKVIDDEAECVFDSKAHVNRLREVLGANIPSALKKVLDREPPADSQESPDGQ